MPLYNVSYTFSPCKRVTRAAALTSKCQSSLPRRLYDPALQTGQDATFSEYSRLFRWPHRKMAKGTNLAILVVIAVTLSFIPSDLGTVDPTNHLQALHDRLLRYNFKQTELPVVYLKSPTSLLYSVNHNKLTVITGYEDHRF